MPDWVAAHEPVPPCLGYVWSVYCELPYPVTWSEIEARSRLTGQRLTVSESELLFELDAVRHEVVNNG